MPNFCCTNCDGTVHVKSLGHRFATTIYYRVVQKIRHCIAYGNFVNIVDRFSKFFTNRKLTKFPTRYV